jgi:hypothetical protein
VYSCMQADTSARHAAIVQKPQVCKANTSLTQRAASVT